MIQQEIIDKLMAINYQPFLFFFRQVNEKADNSFETLKLLKKEEQVTAGRISEYLDIKPSSVTQIIKKLEEMEAIERVKSTEDARVTFVALTEKGQELLADRGVHSEAINEAMFQGFSEQELVQLQSYLSKVEENITSEAFRQQLDELFADDKKWKKFSKMSARFGRAREQMFEHGGFDQWRDGRQRHPHHGAFSHHPHGHPHRSDDLGEHFRHDKPHGRKNKQEEI